MTDIRTRNNGEREICYWSDTFGFRSMFDTSPDEVELVRGPTYKPYSDLTPLAGKTLKLKSFGASVLVIEANRLRAWAGRAINNVDAEYIFVNVTHLDGTPCGELVQ